MGAVVSVDAATSGGARFTVSFPLIASHNDRAISDPEEGASHVPVP